MNARWERLVELFERAKELPREQWREFLEAEASDDRELVEEVLGMLQVGTSSKFIEPPTASGDGSPSRGNEFDSWIGRRFGDFELLEEIGHGGMGIVFRARQSSLGREVAVKVLPPSPMLTARSAEHFEREARAAGRLHHPNVVPIHVVGCDGDTRWFAMELIDGPDLGKEIRRLAGQPVDSRLRLPAFTSVDYVTTVVRLVAQAADALAYAHGEQLIHRDIKPHNLLIDPLGNVRVVDFGVALDERFGEFGVARLAGTIPYMSPEQVRSAGNPVDQRTDVYSLGVVLYELLTLRRPFDGETMEEIFRRIEHAAVPRVRQLNPRIPRDLELICSTAMSRELPDRYASAAELRDDLRRFLNHEAIVARAPSLGRRVHKFAARHRVSLFAIAAAGAALVISSEVAASLSRQRELAKHAGAIERVLAWRAAVDWDEHTDEVVQARGHRDELRGKRLPPALTRLVEEFDRRLAQDRRERIAAGMSALARGQAGPRPGYGDLLAGPSQRDLDQALSIFAKAHSLHGEDPEIARLANVSSVFPRVTLRLSPSTLRSAPRAHEAVAFLRSIDSVTCTVGPPMALGKLPLVERPVPQGYWRFVVVVPEYGSAELTRDLMPRGEPYELTARVLDDEHVHANMTRIEGGRFEFRNTSALGCVMVSDGADYEAFWIDTMEVSNGEYLEFLADTGYLTPARWRDIAPNLTAGVPFDRWLKLPVIGINVLDATAFAEWAGKRLPTHVELERAQRGRDARCRPAETLANEEAGGRCNVFGERRAAGALPEESYALYLSNALPVDEPGYRQEPEGLFHAYGNVAEYTESLLVEPQQRVLRVKYEDRIYLGGAWDAASYGDDLDCHQFTGIDEAYTRDFIGIRCAKHVAPAAGASKEAPNH